MRQLIIILIVGFPFLVMGQNPLSFSFPEQSPAFYDEVWGGAADPVMVWNDQSKEWFIYYTQRRAYYVGETVEWMHGSSIGIATSNDGKKWKYRGTCKGDNNLSNKEKALTTWWAPEVINEKGILHMFVSSVPGVFKDWNATRHIKHFTSKDGVKWKYQSTLPLSSEHCIDAGVCKVGNKWGLWYKDEANGSHTWFAESPDLYSWKVVGPAITDCGHEAPFVWQHDNKYWMIVDAWEKGLRIYRSDDGLTNWVYACTVNGSHPSVYKINDKFIFVRHGGYKKDTPRQTAIHISELTYKDGIYY